MVNIHQKYFTPFNIATSLMDLIDFKDNYKVVDICCGSCNLLNAALRKNNSLDCVGVDINNYKATSNISFHSDDGRSYALKHQSEYDIVLANPPFGKCDTKKYSKKLKIDDYSNITSSRLEIEMFLANLMLLKSTGTLLIIIPTTIIKGQTYKNFRKIISTTHFIESIVDLPKNAFYPEKIKCSALIIQKSRENSAFTKNFIMDEKCNLIKDKDINYNLIKDGIWSKTYEENHDYIIHQGKISSEKFIKGNTGIEVLHTSRRSDSWIPSIRYAELNKTNNYITAENGDILISRIGASAGQKCIYNGPSRYISDCLFVIKSPNNKVKSTIMNTDFTRGIIGLSTPYITAQDISNIYLENK